MNYTEFYNFARGKKGVIYVARKGTVMVFIIDNKTYLLNTTAANGRVIENPVSDYWRNSIDWSGNFSNYFSYGLEPLPDNEMPYKAQPLVPITAEQRKKLKRISQ